ncbi:Bifunctional inhibitor/lipid-transfer protein/seed storage 2S albumin superfamily protein [Raphanus sativus]|nr:Bifunctional inhibitor/lipid-transfer protein/seed storage 2S albumin superfamily protein [Raphanus sativus]
MTLYLTLSLVLFGFASAQPPLGQPPVCPLTLLQIRSCIRILRIGVFLTSRNVGPCCDVLDQLDPPRASVCACDAASINLLGIIVNVRVTQLLRLCRVPTTPDFRCSLI